MTLLSGPNISGNEWKYVKDCLDTGWVSSVGAYVTKFEEMIAGYTGSKFAVATSNGTAALHISLQLAGVTAGDYVLVPNLTFIASVNAVCYTGATPILVDVDMNTWQMDIDLLDRYLSENSTQKDAECYHRDGRRIKAIMPVHVLGNMCDMDKVRILADKFNLEIIEDATEALGSRFKGRHSGSFGLFGTFSFNGNKIITTGGGGMIVTDDEGMAKRAKHLTTQAKSDPFEYFHDETGYNYRLVNVLAAMGVAQMEQLPGFIQKKEAISNHYRSELAGVADIRFQQTTEGAVPNNWLFTIRTSAQRALLNALNGRGLQSRPFWVPMNLLPMYKDSIYVSDSDVAGNLYNECLSIPCSTNITDKELNEVIKTIKETIQG